MPQVEITPVRMVLQVIAASVPVAAGGATDHDDLGSGSLVWTASAHIGDANRFAGFDGAGAAAYYTRAAALALLGVVVVPATALITSDAVDGEVVAAFALESGKKYVITGEHAVAAVSGSTAQNFRMLASGGLVLASGTATWLVAAASQTTAIDVWTAYTAGATDRVARSGIVLSVTTGGTLSIAIRSEVGGVDVESVGGAFVLWEVA